ncbi:MAG: YciI family protein [Candidatus Eremiobacteraeota bacterium]|nr:YciI family protein [Candidatus Eremiobacteraeota bacterium]MBC5827931.1 YciI family protein [Candidatus Eremiobacteraeota bacterium]
MRFMVMVKANQDSEAGVMPTKELLTEMGRFNEELARDGLLLAAEGLQPTSKGARIEFTGEKRRVIEGPFTETKQLIAGFWLIQAESKEKAIERFSRCPFHDGEIEIRQVFEAADFGDELTPELRRAEGRLRAEVAAKQ